MSAIHPMNVDNYLLLNDLCRNLTGIFSQQTSTGLNHTNSLSAFFRIFSSIGAVLLREERLLLNVSIAIVIFWMTIVILSSIMPTLNMEILSLKQSWKELTDSRDSRLDILDVFRVIAIVWVVANHLGSEGRIDILEGLPSAKEFKDAVHNHPILGALLGNSALGVEIFLVLSGLLAATTWHRQANLPFVEHTKMFLIKRVFRLLPIVAVFIFLATGPIMKVLLPRFHNTMVANCGAQGILSHLTLTSNWQSTPTCLGYLWYLGLDMQLYLLAPIVLHLLYRRTRFAVFLIVFLTSASTLMRAFYCTSYGVCNKSDVDIPFIYIPGLSADQVKQMYSGLWEMYGRPCTKCGPFFIGILLGFVINNVHLKLDVPTVRRTFYSAMALSVFVIYAILPEYWYPQQDSNVYNVTYTATFRTVFAFAIAFMIGALFYSVERTRISHFWSILAKLTFNVYLLHMPVVYVFNFVSYLQTTTSAYALVVLLPFVCGLAFLSALLFYLFVESPISRLSSQFLKIIS